MEQIQNTEMRDRVTATRWYKKIYFLITMRDQNIRCLVQSITKWYRIEQHTRGIDINSSLSLVLAAFSAIRF